METGEAECRFDVQCTCVRLDAKIDSKLGPDEMNARLFRFAGLQNIYAE